MAPRGGSHALRMNGDWLCPQCGDLQFARNVQCRICGAGRPPLSSQGGMPGYQNFQQPPWNHNGLSESSNYDMPMAAPRAGMANGAYPGMHYAGTNGMPQTRLQRSRRYPGNGGFNGSFHAGGTNGKGTKHISSTASDAGQGGASKQELVVENGTDSDPHASPLTGGTVPEADQSGGAEEVVVESLDCPHHLAGAIIGRHGSTIAQLRRETRCHIEIEASPGNGAPRTVTVCGPRAAVQDAVNRIHVTLQEKVANNENGEGHPGSGQAASDEDRQRTSGLIDQLEAMNLLRRSWLDERCMEVLMMLPFELTSRVLHEAERVDLWKTRNVSAFLMMLVKTVQQTPDRRDVGQDRMPFRNNHRGQMRPHGMRNDMNNWHQQQQQQQQGNFPMYAPPAGYMAVPVVPGTYPQAYPGIPGQNMYPEYQMAYDANYMAGYQASQAQAQVASPMQGPTMQAPSSPVQTGFAASPFAVMSGSWDQQDSPGSQGGGVSMAVPISPDGVGFQYSPTMAPVVMVPASPQQVALVQQSDIFFEQLPSPSYTGKYREPRDGTQTPEIGSDPGDNLHESFLSMYPANVA